MGGRRASGCAIRCNVACGRTYGVPGHRSRICRVSVRSRWTPRPTTSSHAPQRPVGRRSGPCSRSLCTVSWSRDRPGSPGQPSSRSSGSCGSTHDLPTSRVHSGGRRPRVRPLPRRPPTWTARCTTTRSGHAPCGTSTPRSVGTARTRGSVEALCRGDGRRRGLVEAVRPGEAELRLAGSPRPAAGSRPPSMRAGSCEHGCTSCGAVRRAPAARCVAQPHSIGGWRVGLRRAESRPGPLSRTQGHTRRRGCRLCPYGVDRWLSDVDANDHVRSVAREPVMGAVVFDRHHEAPALKDGDGPEPGPGEVLLDVTGAGALGDRG